MAQCSEPPGCGCPASPENCSSVCSAADRFPEGLQDPATASCDRGPHGALPSAEAHPRPTDSAGDAGLVPRCARARLAGPLQTETGPHPRSRPRVGCLPAERGFPTAAVAGCASRGGAPRGSPGPAPQPHPSLLHPEQPVRAQPLPGTLPGPGRALPAPALGKEAPHRAAPEPLTTMSLHCQLSVGPLMLTGLTPRLRCAPASATLWGTCCVPGFPSPPSARPAGARKQEGARGKHRPRGQEAAA